MDIKGMSEYKLTITLTEPMLGTVPKNKNIYADYIASKGEALRKDLDPLDPAEVEDEINTVPVDEQRGWTGFHSDEKGIFIYDYLVKGFIKEAANVLKDSVPGGDVKKGTEQGVRNLKSKIDQTVFVFPRRIYIGKEPDGVYERPLRAMTAQGPRVTLVRSDTVDAGLVLNLTLKVLPHGEVKEPLLRTLLEYGQFHGLGQFANGSFGRFEYELTKVS